MAYGLGELQGHLRFFDFFPLLFFVSAYSGCFSFHREEEISSQGAGRGKKSCFFNKMALAFLLII
jgi:hypothetical protein